MSEKIGQLKLKSQDGKYRLTDVCDIEVTLADLGKIATREIAKKHKSLGLKENIEVAKQGGSVAKNARIDLESKIGESVITKNNALNYEYKNEDNLLDNK